MWIFVYSEMDDDHHKLLHIPFGFFLVLQDDVWHGGFCGHAENLHLHANIWPIQGYTLGRGYDHLTYSTLESKSYFKIFF